MPQVQRNAQAPERLILRIRNRSGAVAPESLDFSTVTAVSIRVLDSTVVWSASIDSAASDELRVAHVWGAGEIPSRCFLRLSVELTTPGGLRRTGPIHLEVT